MTLARGEAEVDAVVDTIAEGFDIFRTDPGTDIEQMLFAWGSASGTYQRAADDLRAEPPSLVPETVVTELRESLEDAADSLMASVRCAAEGLENGSGPETCQSTFAAATEANTEVAERLLPLVPYGSRSDTEVLALFS
jgi:hypothetical protein